MMVGGAAMRSAASKIAGIVGVLRGSPASPAAPQSVRSGSASSSAGRVPAIVSARGAGDVPQAATAQMLAPEVDDRDFAGFDGEPVGQPMARVVFGGAPSYEEAMAATAELKDAVDRVYLSSTNTTGCEVQLPADQASGLPLPSNSVEIQSSVTGKALATYPAPIHAVQALTMPSQSPGAQSVVASIASDPNVWNALRQNEALKDFLQSQNSSIQFPYMEPQVEESADDAPSDDWISSWNVEEISEGGQKNGLMTMLQNSKLTVEESADDAPSDDWISSRNVEEISEGGHENGLMTMLQNSKLTVEESADDTPSDDRISSRNVEEISEGGHKNGLTTILQNIKLTVEEMVSNVSGFLANIFSPPPAENTSTNTEGNAGPAPGASLMGLALMAIIVVLIRRG